MIDNSHLEGGADTLRNVLNDVRDHTHYQSTKEALDYYIKDPKYKEVYIVRCLDCEADMCIEVLEPQTVNQFKSSHHEGRRRVTLGDDEYPGGRLLSHRKRLDGAMGYRCICGNNTIISKPEMPFVAKTNSIEQLPYLPALEPHQEAAMRVEMARSGYKPDTEQLGNKTRVESFVIERLK